MKAAGIHHQHARAVTARRLLLALLAIPVAALALDRWLGARRRPNPPLAMDMLEVIDAPIEATWAIVADIPRQPEWMHEMKHVRIDTPGPSAARERGSHRADPRDRGDGPCGVPSSSCRCGSRSATRACSRVAASSASRAPTARRRSSAGARPWSCRPPRSGRASRRRSSPGCSRTISTAQRLVETGAADG